MLREDTKKHIERVVKSITDIIGFNNTGITTELVSIHEPNEQFEAARKKEFLIHMEAKCGPKRQFYLTLFSPTERINPFTGEVVKLNRDELCLHDGIYLTRLQGFNGGELVEELQTKNYEAYMKLID